MKRFTCLIIIGILFFGFLPEARSQKNKPIDVGNKTCPVSAEQVNEEMKAAYEYEGKIYNFCCPMCIEIFNKEPEKYIKKVEEELQAKPKEEAMPQRMHEGRPH